MRLFCLLLLTSAIALGLGCEESTPASDMSTGVFNLSGCVIFSAVGGGPELANGIYAIDLDGSSGTLRTLSPDGSDVRASLNGKTTVYAKISPQHSQDIYILSLSGGAEADITHRSQVSEYYPDISASGSLVVFSALYASGGATAICCVNAAGGNLVPLTETLNQTSHAWLPRLSPDGSLIAYIRETSPGARYTLALVAIDGSGQKDVADSHNLYPPQWSPDGRFIACRPPAGSAAGILVIDMQTGGTKGVVAGDWILDANGCARTKDGELFCFGQLSEDAGMKD